MNLPPWETHDRLCSRRNPRVAYPGRICEECAAIAQARAEALDAAREAVAATFGDHPCTRRTCTDDRCAGARKALAAIDALRGTE